MLAIRRSARTSATRANGVMIASRKAICSSVNPPGSRVVQVTTWIAPSVKKSGEAR